MGIEPFDCSATQTLNGSCILGVVVGDSLMHGRTILGFILYDSTKQLWNQIELNSDFDCTLFSCVGFL